MKIKKVAALIMATTVAMSALVGCGGNDKANNASTNAETEATEEAATEEKTEEVESGDTAETATEVTAMTLKVWVPEEEMEITQQMCDSFQEAHPEYDITWDIAVVGVDESIAALTTDPDTAADVFQAPSGGVAQLQEAGLIYPITVDVDNVKSYFGEGAIKACSKDGELYAIPTTPNSWFMYYNKSLFTEDEVKSLETMLAKDLGDDIKNFSCKVSDSWYMEAFFYAAGCQIFGPDGTDPKVVTWNDANGIAAGEYVIDLVNNPKYVEDLDGIAGSLFKEGKLGAVCSGTWDAPAYKEALGENFGAVELPTININGSDVHLSNFADYRAFYVKSNTAQPLAAQQLAEWLANEENQLLRYTEAGASPACLTLQENEALKEDAATCALIAQTQWATPQPVISQINNYWTPVAALGSGIVNGEITKDNLQEKLDAVVESITTEVTE